MEHQNNPNYLYQSLGWTTGIYVLTAFHHYYGSVVYGTPWRAHVVFIGVLTLLLCLLLSWLYVRYQKNLWLYLYLAIAFVIFSFLIGVIEGFYNHTIKDLLYFLISDHTLWHHLFPAPTYEIPDNVIFESTGILQFPVGATQLYYLYKTYKSYKK